jgi:UDP-glucose 4-epimerase
LNATIETLNEILGMNVMPHRVLPRAGDVRHSTADISLARELLGYEPKVAFEAGLKRTIEWFRTQ